MSDFKVQITIEVILCALKNVKSSIGEIKTDTKISQIFAQ